MEAEGVPEILHTSSTMELMDWRRLRMTSSCVENMLEG